MTMPKFVLPRATLHRWTWLLRYWCLDKYAAQVRAGAFVAGVVVLVMVAVRMALDAARPGPRQAFWQIAIYIAILLIAALVAYAMRPKTKAPDPQQGQAPEVKDGRALREAFGTVWVDDPTIVSWSNGTPEPIKKKGGKK
ncbi:MAG: hypothetical protein IAE86_06495 [Burkholderiaceae bacterium]|nr:hypothetical protein [Burkholderiaceae bacterium]